MKKRFTIKALLLLLVVALTSGCVKIELGLKITNSDVDFVYIYGFQKAYASMMSGEDDPFKDTEKEMKEEGFTVEDYSDSAYQGKKATKRLGSLADLSTEEKLGTIELDTDKLDDVKLFQITEKGFFKTTYKASFKTNAMEDVEKGMSASDTTTTTEGTTDDEETGISPDEADDAEEVTKTEEDDYNIAEADDTEVTTTGTEDLEKMGQQMADSMEVTFTVELPSTPGKNNATKVDGKKLTWDLKTIKDGAIEFEFTTLNMTNVFLVGGGALLLLLIIVVVIIMAVRKKGKPEAVEYQDRPAPVTPNENVVTPVAPTSDEPEPVPVGEPKAEVEAPATEETV